MKSLVKLRVQYTQEPLQTLVDRVRRNVLHDVNVRSGVTSVSFVAFATPCPDVVAFCWAREVSKYLDAGGTVEQLALLGLTDPQTVDCPVRRKLEVVRS